MRILARAVVVLLVAGLLAFVVNGADRPADPVLEPPRTAVAGFGQIAFRIDRSAQLERCALLAETPEQRARGLMGRLDLAGHDGMLFRFPADTSGTFHMRNTPLPLSIAWFDAAGRFVGSADMAPCGDRPDCPTYGPGRPYRSALEVKRGGLARLGIGTGAHLQVGGPCG